ncbi:hypothetical protein C9374_008677 [Naegleria lovaniensis]|uniref:eRF1/Pelota-like N-terminal domain-containing protein n=1 Tax=Naegleria lovaniensis TaxID=51637 RepID=A0AA88KFT1_NAELO|nr:uncharacterized protein C9374_008677 [Naegleria lovaniensis]KAG2378055.1 hypothetical protein C9374_008677 [Naegleria lovaniensis]
MLSVSQPQASSSSVATQCSNKQQEQIAVYKYKQLLSELENAKGIGTSVITLLISAKTSMNQVVSQMNDRLTKASNIKSSL